ncbi:hypothetical protein PABG_00952 [Paracoccidioides brasiliensis Pb03]|nr:hypothetical protein PABG_00952 [Paracoccidioides brasiliensis Pb03]
MEEQLLRLLADTQSPAQATRNSAELQLLTLYSNESFPLSLASIASHRSVPTPLRQSALLVLRTFVLAAWSQHLDEFKGQILVSDVNKAHLRRVLLDLATSADAAERKVKSSASYVVSKIASADFPEEWPELLPTLLQIIPNSDEAQLHGALRVLSDLVESGFSEEQFFTVARELVSTVFAVATNPARKPVLRALAVSVFRACFDTLEMVIDQHKVAIKQFLDEALNGWSPFFLATMKVPLPPPPPSEEDEVDDAQGSEEWRGVIALKLQVVKTLMKICAVFPALLTSQSTVLFSSVWDELSTIQNAYQELFIMDERQGRLEDADGLPYTLDFLVLEELDLMQVLLRAPPVKAELHSQLQAAGSAASTSGWLPEVMKLVVSYAQITTEEEGLWDIDVNLFLSEETSLTANYTPRTCGGDLVIKLGEWLKGTTVDALLVYSNALFSDSTSWKLREAALFILNQLLRDFNDVDQQISLEAAKGSNEFVRFCMTQEDVFLRARGYLVAGIIAKTAGEEFHQTALSYLEASIKAIADDPSEVVQVSCIRVLQDFFPALPSSMAKPLQLPAISTVSDFISSRDLREMIDSDDLKFTLLDTLRDTIMVDPGIVLSSIALDVLFNIASSGASNFQLATIVTETFEDIVQYISRQGPEAYIRLCEKVLPSLSGAIDGSTTQENALTTLAADLIRALTEHGLSPLPNGLVATIMPKLNRLLLNSTEGNLLPAATIAVKNMLQHDSQQFQTWQDPQTGKGAIEVVLIIIDHLLSQSVDDNAAEEVGGLAAELVEKAGAEKLGPYLTQLLRAVAQRLATAQKAQFIQSLILVFARLSLVSPGEVVDFLSTLTIDGESGLTVVFSKWLENSINFAGYDEIRQNVVALAKIYQLDDPRVAQVQVKGDLIIQDTGRIKTRSQSRRDPDQYTIVPAPLKIIKVLAEELVSAAGTREMGAAGAAAVTAGAGGAGGNLDETDSDDENDDWEDITPSGQGVLDLGLGITKQELMGYICEDGARGGVAVRQRDDETLAFLMEFFREVAGTPRFQEMFVQLSPREQEALRSLG